MEPVRLVRQRIKGYELKSPNGLGVIYVGRPSKWGNPFYIGYRFDSVFYSTIKTKEEAYDAYVWNYFQHGIPDKKIIIRELRHKNLACWCKPGEKCHADLLLEIANSPE